MFPNLTQLHSVTTNRQRGVTEPPAIRLRWGDRHGRELTPRSVRGMSRKVVPEAPGAAVTSRACDYGWGLGDRREGESEEGGEAAWDMMHAFPVCIQKFTKE